MIQEVKKGRSIKILDCKGAVNRLSK